MKFALVNELKMPPAPKMHGACPFCGAKVISKCGDIKLWHWAHYNKCDCDVWWENETQWYRDWKNCFPIDWQEIIQLDKNKERHIADVKTAQGWVLEFQHSFLKPEERRARNAFYEKLVWIVDGMRRTRDKAHFFKLLNESNLVCTNPHVRKIYLDECSLLKEWSGIHGPVFFDFGEEILWCLLPISQSMWGYVVAFPRHEFIELHNKEPDQMGNFEECLTNLNTLIDLILQQHTLIQRKRCPLQAVSFRRNRMVSSRRRL